MRGDSHEQLRRANSSGDEQWRVSVLSGDQWRIGTVPTRISAAPGGERRGGARPAIAARHPAVVWVRLFPLGQVVRSLTLRERPTGGSLVLLGPPALNCTLPDVYVVNECVKTLIAVLGGG